MHDRAAAETGLAAGLGLRPAPLGPGARGRADHAAACAPPGRSPYGRIVEVGGSKNRPRRDRNQATIRPQDGPMLRRGTRLLRTPVRMGSGLVRPGTARGGRISTDARAERACSWATWWNASCIAAGDGSPG